MRWWGGTTNNSTAQYVSKNVNRDAHGNVIGQGITFTTAVSDGGNYEIDTSGLTGKTGIISPKGIKAEFKPVTKEYDGNTTVTDPTKGLVDSVANQKISGDVVDLNADYDAQYRSPNVKDNRLGTQNNVVYSHLRLTGGDAGNYQLTDKNGNVLAADSTAGYCHTTGNGIITQKVLTGTNLTFFFKTIEKEYDATRGVENAAAGIDHVELDGALSNIVYTVNKAQYDTKDAGAGKQVEYTIGLDKDNYDISGLAGVDPTNGTFTATATTGKITPRTITAVVQENNAITKTYDATMAVTQTADVVKGNVTVAGLLSRQDGSDYTVTAVYTDKNAGDRMVHYTVNLTGDKVNQNYTLKLVDEHGTAIPQLAGRGTINKAVMTANVGKAQRDFDATATIHKTDITGGVTLNGIGGESLTLADGALDKIRGQYGKGTEDAFTPDPHAGHKAVKYQGMADALQYMVDHGTMAEKKIAQNYTIADTLYFAEAVDKGEIKPLAIIGANVHKQENYAIKEYDGTTSLNGATFYKDSTKTDPRDKGLQFFYTTLSGDQIEIRYKGTGEYTDKNAGKGNRVINYTVIGIEDNFAGDYTLDPLAQSKILGDHSVAGNTITPRTIKVRTDAGYDKIYDGTKTVYDANGNQVNNVQYEGLLEADRNQGVKVKTDVIEYAFENANADPEGNVSGTNHVNATVTIENGNGNYTLEDTDDAATVVTTKTFNNLDGKIRQRVVYVDFKAGKGDTAANHKTYDGNAGLGHLAGDDVELKSGGANTGVVGMDDVHLNTGVVQGQYADQNVKRDGDGTPTTKEVYYQNFHLTGSKAGNYAVQASPGKQNGNDKTTLVGRGIINPKLIHAELHYDTGIDKVYDGTTAVTNPNHLKNNLRIQAGDLVGSDTVDSIGLDVERAVYRENPDGTGAEVKDAGKDGGANDALGVDYVLKWTGAGGNYELASFSLKGKGKIVRRTLTYAGGVPTTTKVYDGTDAVKEVDAAEAFTNAFNDAVYRKDYTENPSIAVTTARYTDGVNASVDNQTEDVVTHQVDYTITLRKNNAYGTSNFELIGATDPEKLEATKTGVGTITRRALHMDVPAETAANDTAMEPVPTLRPPVGETGIVSPDAPPNVHIEWEGGKTWAEIRNTPGVYHYQWMADDGSKAGLYGKNYIFDRGTLTIRAAQPDVPVVPILPDGTQVLPDGTRYRPDRGVFAEMDFVPDHLSYQRAARDWDVNHFYRMSAIELRHEKNGVNLSRVPLYGAESRIGIPASAQGARADAAQGLSDLSDYREVELSFADPTEVVREAVMAVEARGAGGNRAEGSALEEAAPTGFLASLSASTAVSDVPAALGIRIHAQEEDVDEATLMAAEPDRDLRIGIETMDGAVNMMAMR